MHLDWQAIFAQPAMQRSLMSSSASASQGQFMSATLKLLAVQELASRGLSIAYRLGTPDTQKVLLDALVGSLQGASLSTAASCAAVQGSDARAGVSCCASQLCMTSVQARCA